MTFVAKCILVHRKFRCFHAIIGLLRFSFRPALAVGLILLTVLGKESIVHNVVRIRIPSRCLVPTRCMGPVAGKTHHLGRGGIRTEKIGVIRFGM